MKKNLLFVMSDLSAGGAEKSLVNLLSQIDYEKHNVDLFLLNKSGIFLKLIPSEVNILNTPNEYNIFTTGVLKSIKSFVKKRKFLLAYFRLKYSFSIKAVKDVSNSEQYSWKYLSKSLSILDKDYDIAIGYLEMNPIYFIIDKVKSIKKIGWIHTNYSNSEMKKEVDNPYFTKLDYIVTVSDECGNSLKENFLHLKDKIKVVNNIVSTKIIRDLAIQEIEDEMIFDKEYINILTIARLSHEKGLDIAIKACNLLLSRGHKIRWFVLGEGTEKQNLEKLISHYGLGEKFKLLGVKENPYPYLMNADVYVQPSRYEGKSIAVEEARILNKPIVVTNYETARDQITDGEDGLIVEMTKVGISIGIEKFINNVEMKSKVKNNLSHKNFGTEKEINKLYELF
ncbi:glycosyl transferase [Bacillus sp. AFS002410]|uniref:glycosyltransferase n=1 Tax=Bacillus sp. AFS002410 TaxID=2033481 RepID=UPI000BEFAC7A|nr:glycosyltransferase [Bacillus sp. AFS002410]PEJ58453.1 glycosyl transferase [Bacillus sp. AFS002410]